jgi:hypothetical protein
MRRAIVVGAFLVAIAGCTDVDGARDALRKAGYTQIEVGGYAAFSCSDDDTFATKFKAIGPSGLSVTGAVCGGGLFKGKTIRID